jgi:RND family efflux transporter MFP subunit
VKRFAIFLLAALLIAGAAISGFVVGHGGAGVKPEAQAVAEPPEKKPTAHVTTALIVRGEMPQTVTAYGTVVAQPSEMRIVSVPFESRAGRPLVTPGESIEAGTPLLSVEPSPDALLQLHQAEIALEAAKVNLAQTQARFNEKLATNQEQATAQQAVQAAQLSLDSLKSRGIGASKTLDATVAGVVAKVDVQEGQIVPPGGPLVEIIGQNRMEVRLGVEPADAPKLRAQQPVSLQLINTPTTQLFEGRVRLVTRNVNPDTRLVDVFVTPSPDKPLLLAAYVRGELAISTRSGLIVPRSAVLPDEDDTWTLFTVKDEKAVKHDVKVVLQNDSIALVEAAGLQPGQIVVSVGNYELEDGMGVESSPVGGGPQTQEAQGGKPEAAR